MADAKRDQLANLFDQAMNNRDADEGKISAELEEKESRYEGRKALARGGMKQIYHVRDLSTDREVAMAVLLDGNDDLVQENFLREARVTARLQHPNIIPVYDMGFLDGEAFFTMKLLKGITLEDLLKHLEAGKENYLARFTIQERLKIFLRICEAIDYAHAQGVIHLDIKPANIHLSALSEVTVCDWGLAKVLDEVDADVYLSRYSIDQYELKNLTIDGFIKGTPGFMAPEQLSTKGQKDERTDVYALGALLYKLLTLENLVNSQNFEEYRQLTLAGDIKAPSLVNDQVDQSLEAICLKAVAVKPEERYQAVHDLLMDLNRYLDGFMPFAEGGSFLKQFVLLYRRNRALINTLVASVLLIIFALTYFSWSINQQKQETLKAYDSLAKKEQETLKAYDELAKKEQETLKAYDSLAKKEQETQKAYNELKLAQQAEKKAQEAEKQAQRAKQLAEEAEDKAQEDKKKVTKELLMSYFRGAQTAYDSLDYANAQLNLNTCYLLDKDFTEGEELKRKLLMASANFEELERLKAPIIELLPEGVSAQQKVKSLLELLKDSGDEGLYRLVQLNSYKRHFISDAEKAEYLANALRLDNPHLRNIKVRFKGASLYLSNNGNIKDLRVVNAFPVKNLSFYRSKVENLKGLNLKGLRQLNMAYSNLRDLPSFEGCQFDKLNLSFCPIIFPFNLAEGEIKELNVMGTSFMFDRIRDFKNIKTIVVNKRFEGKILVGLTNLKYQNERDGDLQRATRIHHFIRLDGDKNGVLPNYELQDYKKLLRDWDQDQDKLVSFDEFLPNDIYKKEAQELEENYTSMIHKQGMALNGPPKGQRGEGRKMGEKPDRNDSDRPERRGPDRKSVV